MQKPEMQNAPDTTWFDGVVSPGAKQASRRPADLAHLQLAPVRRAFSEYRQTRERDAVYLYLDAVFALVEKWIRLGCAKHRTSIVLRQHNVRLSGNSDPFAAVIACTPQTDSRTASKWARALRYAAALKEKSEPVADFIHRNGGINACATLWSRNRDQLRSRGQ